MEKTNRINPSKNLNQTQKHAHSGQQQQKQSFGHKEMNKDLKNKK